jgi:hypothetical protein
MSGNHLATNRRSVLQAIGAGATGISLGDVLNWKDLNNYSEEYRYIARWMHDEVKPVKPDSPAPGQRKPRYDTMELEHWLRTESALKAAERLQDQLDQSISHQLGLPEAPNNRIKVAITGTNNHWKERELEVTYTHIERNEGTVSPPVSLDFIQEQIPSRVRASHSVEGKEREFTFDVSLTEQTRSNGSSTASCGEYYTGPYDDVLSGVEVVCDGSSGTSSAVAYDNINEEFTMLGAGHVLSTTHDVTASTGDGDADGNVTRANNTEDEDFAIFADESGDEFYSSKLAETSAEIAGVETWETITSKVNSDDYGVEHQGHTTGRTTGKIDKTYPDHHIVWTTCSFDAGDSGGPQFYRTGESNNGREQCSYICIANWYYDDGTCPEERCAGNSGEYIEDNHYVDIY